MRLSQFSHLLLIKLILQLLSLLPLPLGRSVSALGIWTALYFDCWNVNSVWLIGSIVAVTRVVGSLLFNMNFCGDLLWILFIIFHTIIYACPLLLLSVLKRISRNAKGELYLIIEPTVLSHGIACLLIFHLCGLSGSLVRNLDIKLKILSKAVRTSHLCRYRF